MPDTHNTKNYMAHGGNELVIGGKLTFLPGASVEGGEGLFDGGGDSAYTLPAATADTLGGVIGEAYADPYGQGRIVVIDEAP